MEKYSKTFWIDKCKVAACNLRNLQDVAVKLAVHIN